MAGWEARDATRSGEFMKMGKAREIGDSKPKNRSTREVFTCARFGTWPLVICMFTSWDLSLSVSGGQPVSLGVCVLSHATGWVYTHGQLCLDVRLHSRCVFGSWLSSSCIWWDNEVQVLLRRLLGTCHQYLAAEKSRRQTGRDGMLAYFNKAASLDILHMQVSSPLLRFWLIGTSQTIPRHSVIKISK